MLLMLMIMPNTSLLPPADIVADVSFQSSPSPSLFAMLGWLLGNVEGLALGASSHLVVVSTNLWSNFSGGEVGWRRSGSEEWSESTRSYLWVLLRQKEPLVATPQSPVQSALKVVYEQHFKLFVVLKRVPTESEELVLKRA
jgi:hypothetical protein